MTIHENDGEIDADLVVKIADAKARLSELIARAETGEKVIIARGRDPVIELKALQPVRSPIGILASLGIDVDLALLERQLDEPYTDAELDDFEGDLDNELGIA
ncbi:MAG: type II toxin-antitoxin system prevent-host-death family antitoxin [Pseudomonadota bacterium]